jgi:hypothetical protein
MGNKLGDVLLAAKITGVQIQLSDDTQQPLIMECETFEQKKNFLLTLFSRPGSARSEEFLWLKDANTQRLGQAINRLIITGSIWSEQAFNYGCE